MGLHVDTSVLCAKSHHCGISSFPPKFPVWGGFDDRYHLFCMWIVVCRVDTLLRRGYFLVGLMGAKWGRCTKNPTEIPPHTPQDEQSLHRPTPSGFAFTLHVHGNIRHGTESRHRGALYGSNVGGRRQGSRLLRLIPLFGAPKWHPSKN